MVSAAWLPVGRLRTVLVSPSRVYIPQVFFCRSVRGFDSKSVNCFFGVLFAVFIGRCIGYTVSALEEVSYGG